MTELTYIGQRVQDTDFQLVLKKGTIKDAVFQHSVLCQTFLLYRNPGPDARIWKQKQRNISLAIQGGETYNPEMTILNSSACPMARKPASSLPILIASPSELNQKR